MAQPSSDRKVAGNLNARLSLREPQRKSLSILVDLLGQLELEKEPNLDEWLSKVRSLYPSVEAFEREFPSLCFAIATGVGKTRLMGAMIAWLYITGRSRHFLVLAPNLTIYEKLKNDFRLGSSKYVFTGVPEIANTPPVIVTGEDYEEGRGVRLDYAVPASLTGDLFGADSSLHINIFNISKINARESKKGAAKSSVAKVRRLQEYLGESYFDYLAGLSDLVVLMDEAHRYYADAGAKAINDLRPVLGIELTATPKTVGMAPRAFGNVVYHYPLSNAMRDGFVKIPAVATRKNFRSDQYTLDELERIKLEDGIHHHEYVKVELENYSRANAVRLVKPFMLVVAQDTAHAAAIRSKIESDTFFSGRYRDRVIEVHSNLSGAESDESMQRLLEVESDESTEVVVHVNKLKEGWDVTNLYTIVPLRASASEILTEQTLGRGLRLPYGKRTGVDAIDRLCIIAHERFDEIIKRSNMPDSLIHESVYIGGDKDSDIPDREPRLLESSPLSVVQSLEVGSAPKQTSRYEVKVETEQQVEIAGAAIYALQAEAKNVSSSEALRTEEIQKKLVKQVQIALDEKRPAQVQLAGMETPIPSLDDIKSLVRQVTDKLVELTIDVPHITVLPTREVNYGFKEFDLDNLEKIRFDPVTKEVLLRHLEDNHSSSIQWAGQEARESRPEDYLVRHLLDRDEVDYDLYAELLYKLAGQMVAHLRSYLSTEEDVENVLLYWQRQLGDFIWVQMYERRWSTPCDYQGKVVPGFDVLRPASYTLAAGDKPRHFRSPIDNKRSIRMMIFEGFSRCCHPYQKFDSVGGEWALAQLLEDDPDVLKWMKPAARQFRIEYENGKNYEPDFVAEMEKEFLIIEPKRSDQINQKEVQDKARAAVKWCGFANQHAELNGGKPWFYVLVPDDKILAGMSIGHLKAEFCIRN